MDRIKVIGSSFVDEDGRERIFNGVNLVHKGSNINGNIRKDYFPQWREDMFKKLSEMGINLIRFGLIWDAVEPEPNIFDEKYLSFMKNYVKICEKYGIYVYLDMHQDLYAASYEDGAPDWAIVSDSYKYKPGKIIWSEAYFFNTAVQRCFDNFWNNTPVLGKGLQDYYAEMWQHVAKTFSDCSNILGYDIMNEPYPGTTGKYIFTKIKNMSIKNIMFTNKIKKIKTIKNMIHGDTIVEALNALDESDIVKSSVSAGNTLTYLFDADKYYPFLKRVSQAIRKVDGDGIIIMENSFYSNAGVPCVTPRLKYDDGQQEPNLAFAPHGYDITVDSKWTNTASNKRVDDIFNQHKKTQERLKVPVIVGEWGGMVTGCSEYPHMEHLLQKFDSNKWSQTYWCFFPELAESKIMKTISRPYPVAVPGEITKYNYNRQANVFRLKFSLEKASRKKAVIYSPVEPKIIEANGKYKTEHIDSSDAVYIYIGAVKGENEVVLRY